jgi:hypothetical protein
MSLQIGNDASFGESFSQCSLTNQLSHTKRENRIKLTSGSRYCKWRATALTKEPEERSLRFRVQQQVQKLLDLAQAIRLEVLKHGASRLRICWRFLPLQHIHQILVARRQVHAAVLRIDEVVHLLILAPPGLTRNHLARDGWRLSTVHSRRESVRKKALNLGVVEAACSRYSGGDFDQHFAGVLGNAFAASAELKIYHDASEKS